MRPSGPEIIELPLGGHREIVGHVECVPAAGFVIPNP